jgi:excinuclease ABC subunit C
MKNSLSKKIKNLPSKPGVYFFKNAKGETIYIGKSVNLKNRVKSYFQKTNQLGPFTQKMVGEIANIKWQELNSEFEALILEAKLINEFQPHYNIRSKDDKSFALIAITHEDYPRILVTRDRTLNAKYFGPFISARDTRRVLKTIRRIFPYCTCKPNTGKPCMYYHLGLCPGCCLGYPKSEYHKTIKKIVQLLSGRTKQLVTLLKKEMANFSAKQEFEKAASIKQQLAALINVTSHWQSLTNEDLSLELQKDKTKQVLAQARQIYPQLNKLQRIECYDISNLFGSHATGSLVVFENLTPNKDQYRKFKIKTVVGPDDTAMMNEVISRRLNHPGWPYPDLMIVDGGKGQISAAFSALREKSLTAIPLIGLTKHEEVIIKPTIVRAPARTKIQEVIDFSPSARRINNIDTIVGFQEIRLKRDSLLLRLIQQLRDESHRFARNYHLFLRKRQILV